MFKKILVPISSEFYSKKVIERSIYLANTFQSTVHILYIIEDTPMQQMEKFSDTHLTYYNRTETHQKLVKNKSQTADTIHNELQPCYTEKGITMTFSFVHGDFGISAKNELNNNDYDLVLIGYEKQCMIDYRLINEITIPIWIEGGGHHRSILAICSNLAPNQKVPEISIKLAESFDWDLSMLYVTDLQDAVEVDKNGIRSPRKAKRDLFSSGQNFVNEMSEKNISVKTVEGKLENEIIKEAKHLAVGLIIIGREQKKRGTLGFPAKNVKQKMVEKCRYSLLFIN